MNVWKGLVFAAAALFCLPLSAQNQRKYQPPAAAPAIVQGSEWTRTLTDAVVRGKLQDAFQFVRGDSGKWSDETTLIPATLDPTQAGIRIDDQLDRKLAATAGPLPSGQDVWLLVRTRQYDDNDRIWIERIERRGNRISVVMDEAIWQGKYFKTFTYYETYGVNLGKLAPGEYTVEWTIRPRRFQRFAGDGKPLPENWPQDDVASGKGDAVIRTTTTVAGDSR
jgi:hypothetical protein